MSDESLVPEEEPDKEERKFTLLTYNYFFIVIIGFMNVVLSFRLNTDLTTTIDLSGPIVGTFLIPCIIAYIGFKSFRFSNLLTNIILSIGMVIMLFSAFAMRMDQVRETLDAMTPEERQALTEMIEGAKE